MAVIDAPASDVVTSQNAESVTPFAMGESKTCLSQGNAHLENGKLAEAAECFRRAITHNPNYAEAYTNLGYVFQVQGNLDEAITHYRKAVLINPSLLMAHQNLSFILMNLGLSEAAEASLRQMVALAPAHSAALHNLGMIVAQRGDFPEAEIFLRRAIESQPDDAEIQNSLGNLLKQTKRQLEAEAAYRRALDLKPNYAEAHYNLGLLLMENKCLPEAEGCFRCALELKPDFAKTYNALGLLLVNNKFFDEAEASFRRALELNPDLAETHRDLGLLLMENMRLTEAEAAFRHALEIKPDFAEAHINLGSALRNLGRLDEAVASYRKAIDNAPYSAVAHYNLGAVMQELNQLDSAAASYFRAVELNPDYVEANNFLGNVLVRLGKIDEAEKFLTKAMELAPGQVKPLVSALSFIPYRQDDPRFNQLEIIYARRKSLPIEEQIMINFAMGSAMTNIGQYDRAFKAYEEGNQLHNQVDPFDEAVAERFLEKTSGYFTAELFKEYAALANTLTAIKDERVPIFIVGMPRSGTSLIEQILASYPGIYGAGELTTMNEVAQEANNLFLNSQNLEDNLLALRKLGKSYLDQVWHLAPNAHYISDKMPGNFNHLGLIHLMLPNAKIIHSMRDPVDTCFSCYTLQFVQGHEYSYDLRMLGRQYLRYIKLMKHWKEVLPSDRMLDVRYEDNINNPEREARRLLDYLGLEWDPACLNFHENKRTVNTASVTQVRKPIYSSSVARWKPFEDYLKPLLETIYPAA